MASIRGWLRKDPPAFAVRCIDCANDEGNQTVDINQKDQRRWVRAEETITAMRPTSIQALRKDGTVLRALPIVWPEEPDADAGVEDDKEDKKGKRGELAQLAKLLNEAHDAGARRHAEAYKETFVMMSDITKRAADTVIVASKTINSLMMTLKKAGTGAAGEAVDDDEDMMKFFSKQAKERIGAELFGGKSNGATNGAATNPLDPSHYTNEQLQAAIDGMNEVIKSRQGS